MDTGIGDWDLAQDGNLAVPPPISKYEPFFLTRKSKKAEAEAQVKPLLTPLNHLLLTPTRILQTPPNPSLISLLLLMLWPHKRI